MTIKDVETRTGLPRASVRYYESEGLIFPARGRNSYRDYSEQDVADLMKIKLLRELECSLEDIKALQSGAKELDAVLDQRLEDLRQEADKLVWAQEVCRRLRADGATYATLRPRQYYANSASRSWAPPPELTVRSYRPDAPWRRYFARMMDLTLCNLAVYLTLALPLGASNLRQGTGYDVFCTVLAMVLMIFLEPLFLRFLGTTPGKWAFGLRLTRVDGAKLSYGEARGRTFRVLLFGMGFSIPLVGLIALILSYRRDKREEDHPWEQSAERYEDVTHGDWSGRHVVKAVGCYAAVVALTIAALIGGEYAVSQPPSAQVETVAQFARNYNDLLRYRNSPNAPAYILDDAGAWQQRDPSTVIVSFAPDPRPDFHYETDGETLTGLSFTYQPTLDGGKEDVALAYVPREQVQLTAMALTGHGVYSAAQEPELERLLEDLDYLQRGTTTYDLPGWQVTLTWEPDNSGLSDPNVFTVFIPDGAAPPNVRLDFTARRR